MASEVRRRHRGRLVAVCLLVLAFALTACGGRAGTPDSTDDDGFHGAVLTDWYDVPETTLTSTSGKPFDVIADTTKPLTLVFFGYTNCPDICQAVMADITTALTRLDADQRAQVEMLFITTDPARDTAPALRRYLDRYNPDFEGLTGRLADITRLGTALGVPIEKGEKLPTGGYDVAHGTQILAVGTDDRVPIVWTEGTPAADLADDISRLLDHPLEDQ